MKTTVFAVLAAVLISACGQPEPCPELPVANLDSIRAEIEALENVYAEALANKDVELLMTYYADDAHCMADGQPALVGRDAIRAYVSGNFEADTSGTTIDFAVTGIWAGGAYVTETGTWSVKSAEGEELETGKYLSLFEKRDGKYVAIREIWNSDSEGKEEAENDEGGAEADA